ncbi:hypothetical protein diail_2493 [Diaporthe ilicicola]|nr:hypothetical protein diail_2493 [Diaporthe ilicicola]
MSSADELLLPVLFQIDSAIAVLGFLSLLAKALVGAFRKWNTREEADSPVMLSAVSSGDELQKPTVPDGEPPSPEKTETDQGAEMLEEGSLHDRLDALLAQCRSRAGDITRQIDHAAATYLVAAEDLLKLHHGEGRGESRAELQAAASALVRETADQIKLLPLLGQTHKTDISTATVIAACGLAEAAWGDKHLDLTRFTLGGEPRRAVDTAGLLPYLLGHVISAGGHAFLCVAHGLYSVTGL